MGRWQAIICFISFFGAYLMFLTSINIWKTNSIELPAHGTNAPQLPDQYEEPPPMFAPLPSIFSMPQWNQQPEAIPIQQDNIQETNPINTSWSGIYGCYDYGEVFAASFLASSDTFIGMKKYKSVLKSHRAAHASHYLTWERQAYKTLDFLDFFVEHLSAYERVSSCFPLSILLLLVSRHYFLFDFNNTKISVIHI